MLRRLLFGVAFLALGAFGSLEAQSSSSTQSGTGSQYGTEQSSQSDSQMSGTDQDFAQNAYQANLTQIQMGQGRSDYGSSRPSDQSNTATNQFSRQPSDSSGSESNAMTGNQNRKLPRTASSTPLFGLAGLLLIGAALIVRSLLRDNR